MELEINSSFRNFKGKENIQLGFDLDNTHNLMSILRNNIYSNPIESFVREIYNLFYLSVC